MTTIDATALTLDVFSLSGTGLFGADVPRALALAPGTYRLSTLFGPGFEFLVTGTGTVDYDPGLTFLSGAGTTELTVNGFRIQVDATALTFNEFSLMETGSGLTELFSTGTVQTLTLIPGDYRLGTLFGPTFTFSVTGTGTVDHAPGLTFLSGAGTTLLEVNGCRIQVDATALTFDELSLMETGSGLTEFFPTGTVQTLTLIPGDYRLGTLFGPIFVFSVTGTGTVDHDSSLTFLSGKGTTLLTVNGFLLSVDATHLTLPSFTLNDSGSGLGEPFATTSRQCVTLLPGPYAFTCGFSFRFSVTGTGVFDYDPDFASCVSGLGTQRLRVSCDPTGPSS